MRIVSVAASMLALLCLPSLASASFQSDGQHQQQAQELSQDAREALASAMDVAKQHGDARWAFTMAYTDLGEDGPKTYRLRFDPRLAEDERWQLLDPAFESLSKDEKKTFKQIQGRDDADDGLIYDQLPIDFEQLMFVSEDDTRAVFEAAIVGDEMPKKMREAVKMTITVNKVDAYLEEITMRSIEPFKPAPIAKINTFEQIQRYVPSSEGGPALMRDAHSDVSGKAMLKKFESKSKITYSEFEKVEIAEDQDEL